MRGRHTTNLLEEFIAVDNEIRADEPMDDQTEQVTHILEEMIVLPFTSLSILMTKVERYAAVLPVTASPNDANLYERENERGEQ